MHAKCSLDSRQLMRPGIEAIQVQTMKTQGVQLLLLLLCVVSTCWGQQGNTSSGV